MLAVSAGVRVPLTEAIAGASELEMMLHPVTERVEVAGSIRRGRPDVGDIELVAVPRYQSDGLFGTATVNLLTERVDHLIERGYLASHPTDPKRGERYSKLFLPSRGLQVDLFSATEATFGLILLIRTGPAAYSQRFVTDLRRRSLHVAGGALHRGGLGCGAYVCETVPTPDEADVFGAAGWPVTPPELRS